MKYLLALLLLGLTGCQRVVPSTAKKPCRFELASTATQATFQAAEDFSSPPGAYEKMGPAQVIQIKNQRVLWGSWYLAPFRPLRGEEQRLFVSVADKTGWLDLPLPLDGAQLKGLRKQYPQGDILAVPFNRKERLLIRQEGPTYSIYDVQTATVLWRDGGRYEAPTIDFTTDLLHCNGDLDFTSYTFDSSGIAR